MGHGQVRALVVLQMTNILHHKRIWPYETVFFVHVNILRTIHELLVAHVAATHAHDDCAHANGKLIMVHITCA